MSYIKHKHTSLAHIFILPFLLLVRRLVAPTEILHDPTVSANLNFNLLRDFHYFKGKIFGVVNIPQISQSNKP
jgi:hypothetical protein